MTDSKSGQQKRPRRKWRRRVIVVVALGLLGWFAHYAWLRVTLEPQPRDEYWMAKIHELDPVSADAMSYQEVYDELSDMPWVDDLGNRYPGLPVHFSSILDGPWDLFRGDVSGASRFFRTEGFADARSRIISLARKDWRTGDSSFNPRNSLQRKWIYILLAHSRWALEYGDKDVAIENWMTVLRIGRQMRRYRSLHGFVYEAYIQRHVAHEIIFASQHPSQVLDAKTLEQGIRSISGGYPTVSDLITGEVYYTRKELDCRYVRHGDGWLDVPSVWRAGETPGSFPPVDRYERLWNLASFIFHDYGEAIAVIDSKHELFMTFQSIVDLIEHSDRLGEQGLDYVDGFYEWPPVYTRRTNDHLFVAIVGGRMMLDAAVTMHAIRQYAVEHNRYPESLDSLEPEYCSVPMDAVDGEPLRYSADEDGFVLYSIWFDKNDDGGRSNPKILERFRETETGDIVFTNLIRNDEFDDKVVEVSE